MLPPGGRERNCKTQGDPGSNQIRGRQVLKTSVHRPQGTCFPIPGTRVPVLGLGRGEQETYIPILPVPRVSCDLSSIPPWGMEKSRRTPSLGLLSFAVSSARWAGRPRAFWLLLLLVMTTSGLVPEKLEACSAHLSACLVSPQATCLPVLIASLVLLAT